MFSYLLHPSYSYTRANRQLYEPPREKKSFTKRNEAKGETGGSFVYPVAEGEGTINPFAEKPIMRKRHETRIRQKNQKKKVKIRKCKWVESSVDLGRK